MFKGERVFISGGNGVIGNCLVRKLYAAGAIILVGDVKPRPAHWPSEIRYRQGDLNFIRKEELEDFQPAYFFHLAATFERSAETYSFWSENFQHNIRLSNYLMTCLKDCSSLKKVIFASSYLIYDPRLYQFDSPVDIPYSLKETDPIYPRNLTGIAKLTHEIELRFINHFKGAQYKIVSARIYRGHGCNSRDIISRWVRALIHGETLTVYRKENTFDYIYGEDSAGGLIRLAACQAAEGVINLGTGKSRLVADVVDILKTHFPDMTYKEDDPPEVIPYESSQADITLLKELTGWTPEYSLEESIGEIVAFERRRGGLYSQHELPEMNVLVTSISRKVPLLDGVRAALYKLGGSNRLFGGDINGDVTGRYFVDEFWLMPRLSGDSVAETILKYCLNNGIRVIIPTRDGELPFWAKHKEYFAEKGINIMVSGEEAIECTLDKLQFFLKLRELGLPAIHTALSPAEIGAGPFVVKEQFGAGALNVGLDLSGEAAVAHAARLKDPVFQPYVVGKEYSSDVYVGEDSQVKGVIVRSRDSVISGESQITTLVDKPALEQLSIRVAVALKLSGHAVLQVIEDEAGGLHIIECNARFGGASTLSLSGGLDSFYWYMLEVSGISLADYPFVKVKSPLKQVRHASDRLIYG